MRDRCLAAGEKKLNAAIRRQDSKARLVSKMDDFEYIKDRTLLLAAEELGVLDKANRSALEEALNLRNRCGHPTSYKPGIKKASSFIEDVVNIVFA